MNKNPSMKGSSENISKLFNPKLTPAEKIKNDYWAKQDEIKKLMENLK